MGFRKRLGIAAAALLAASGVTSAEAPGTRVPTPRPSGAQPAPAPAQGERSGQRLDARQERVLGTLRQRAEQGQELGRLARERGASRQVKELGRQLGEDHARVARELEALAAERGVDAARLRGPAAEREAHVAMVERLERLSGADFDRTFLRALEYAQRGHRAELQAWRDGTPGEDARLKRWLADVERVAEADLLASRNAMAALGHAWHEEPPEAAGRRPTGIRAPRHTR